MTRPTQEQIDGLKAGDRIEIDGESYARFIPYPGPVRDGTVRCICCGQIDEPEYHTLTCAEAIAVLGAEA